MIQGRENDRLLGDALIKLEGYARGMWRYRGRALLLTWIIAIGSWFAVYSMPNVYEAQARIYVDTESAIQPLLQGIATQSNLMNQVNVVTREMLSRPNVAEVARDTDLHLRAKTDKEFQDLVDSLQQRISVVGNRENIFSIMYRDADREKAIAVVDALVNTFVEKSLGADRTDSNRAQAFLRDQIDIYENRLNEAEDRLAKFKQEHVEVMPGQQGNYFSRLQAARTELETARSKLQLAVERRSELERQLEGEVPVFGIMSQGPSEQSGGGFTSAKIRELEVQLEELRLRYTDKHPRIGQILDTIELLRQQEAEEQQAAQASGRQIPGSTSTPLQQNPVYQNMRIQLSNTEVEIASLRAELQQKQEQVSELQRLVDTVPQVEAELNRLNRDYGVVKAKHEQLLRQLESANIGEDVDATIDEVQFRIIDPPFAPLQPTGPKRALFMSGGLVVAVGAGGALTFLLNLLHPVFFSNRALTVATGLPVLGSVSLTLSEEQARKKRASRFRFIAMLSLLLVAFTVMSVFADRWSPLVRNLSGVSF